MLQKQEADQSDEVSVYNCVYAYLHCRKRSPVISPYRFEVGFQLLNKWLCIRQRGRRLTPFFEDNELKSVVIYGLGAMGERLLEELRASEIEVAYAIDRMAHVRHIEGLKIYSAGEDTYAGADAIVVTPVQDYKAIVESLAGRTDLPVLSLEDIIEYCMLLS